MNDIIIIDKINEVFLKTSKITISQQLELNDAFKCKAKNFWFHPKFKSGIWSGDIYFYNINTGLFPIGLLPYFINFCKKFNYNYKFNFDIFSLKNNILDEDIEKLYINIFKCSFKPRDYQDLAIKKALRNKRGIIELPTASGKSLILYTLIRFILATSNKKILLVVPSINLVNQMFSDFKEYGFSNCEFYTSLIYGISKQKDWNKQLIISTYQSIFNKPLSFYEDFEMVIIDECHGASANSYKKILEKCINAQYRIGLTGSLQDINNKNEKSEYLTITGYLGPVIVKEKTQNLINKGYLSNILIYNLILKYPEDIIKLTKFESYNYIQEIDIIYSYDKRNKILNYIINNINKEHNILLLCHEIEDHLKVVENYIKNNFNNWKIYIIHGQIKANKRELIRQEMINKGGNILLASYGTLATGVNIPRLHEIIFFSSYKSKIKILQSLGRGLRKHESKDKLIVYDIIDDLTYSTFKFDKEVLHKNYVYKHWLDRCNYYKQQGFEYINKKIFLEEL